jgi:boron transporter
MYRRTGEFFGVNEGLFSSAFAAMVFSILGTQPLTIVGVTGLISLFNFTIYDIIEIYDISIYPQFICWTAIWAAIFHWAVAIFNWCDYMRYVTDFSSESFGMYVGIIYISESNLCRLACLSRCMLCSRKSMLTGFPSQGC